VFPLHEFVDAEGEKCGEICGEKGGRGLLRGGEKVF